MFMRKFTWPVLAASLLFCTLAVTSALAGPKWLITPEEAARVRSPAGIVTLTLFTWFED